jgi:hypothetical protein
MVAGRITKTAKMAQIRAAARALIDSQKTKISADKIKELNGILQKFAPGEKPIVIPVTFYTIQLSDTLIMQLKDENLTNEICNELNTLMQE